MRPSEGKTMPQRTLKFDQYQLHKGRSSDKSPETPPLPPINCGALQGGGNGHDNSFPALGQLLPVLSIGPSGLGGYCQREWWGKEASHE